MPCRTKKCLSCWLADNQLTLCLPVRPNVSLYIHVAALVDVLGVTAIESSALQLLYVGTDWTKELKGHWLLQVLMQPSEDIAWFRVWICRKFAQIVNYNLQTFTTEGNGVELGAQPVLGTKERISLLWVPQVCGSVILNHFSTLPTINGPKKFKLGLWALKLFFHHANVFHIFRNCARGRICLSKGSG